MKGSMRMVVLVNLKEMIGHMEKKMEHMHSEMEERMGHIDKDMERMCKIL